MIATGFLDPAAMVRAGALLMPRRATSSYAARGRIGYITKGLTRGSIAGASNHLGSVLVLGDKMEEPKKPQPKRAASTGKARRVSIVSAKLRKFVANSKVKKPGGKRQVPGTWPQLPDTLT
jgi:hypothetical protein